MHSQGNVMTKNLHTEVLSVVLFAIKLKKKKKLSLVMEKQINEVGTRLSEVSPEWWQQVAGGMKEAMNRKEKAWQ